MGKIRGTHSSPGHYTQITDLQYAAKNFGITTLGLVGETLKGPAFEPIETKDWEEFVRYFGGTSAEKFRDTLFPKYELPYIAKEYLKASDQLYVCRVLGFSGYDAGPAFILKVKFGNNNYPVAVLRSRGSYTDADPTVNACQPDANYDKIIFKCDKVELAVYEKATSQINGCSTTYTNSAHALTASSSNKGRFTLVAKKNNSEVGRYPVSLNPGDKDYIYNVLGTDALNGSSAIFVEELYDIMLDDLIIENNGVDGSYEPGELTSVSSLFSDYHEQFRCAVTPWIVSELKGTGTGAQVKRLFRFYTISDGNCANSEVKISITNIRPDEGTFDVLIRDFNDGDGNPVILESFKGVNMVPGDRRYIGLRMGTANGDYELKSKYVMVDIIEDELTKECVPAGFLGYPVRTYPSGLKSPFFSYNTTFNEEIREKKQYFGLSDLNGVDVDMLTYKGKDAYKFDNTENINDSYLTGYTAGFHLDSRLSKAYLDAAATGGAKVTIDGKESTSGASWSVVSGENKGSNKNLIPVIASESEMNGTIYENINLRKFTVYPYGGFDGWDVYRGSRTNTDKYKASKYKGEIGEGKTFSKNIDATTFSLPSTFITSDYYAYLAGAKQFENPEIFEINLFATPGIDYLHQTLLSNEIVDIIENRLDCFYVMTTPDKPAGASYAVDEMFSASDAADNVEIAGIDTYYASTYYPWAKYYDSENSIYINLPATRDVLRNMANTDNKRFPWVAPAGLERGVVNAKNLRYFPKIEDRDTVYDGRINSLIKFSKEGIRVWGNKTLYVCEDTNPMNRINTVRGLLYIRKVIIESTRGLFFEPNDESLCDEFETIVRSILDQAEDDRGIVDYRLKTSQTPEQMDLHELSGTLFVKFTPDLEFIELNFVVTPLGISFDDIS